jgi:hypothetical protein
MPNIEFHLDLTRAATDQQPDSEDKRLLVKT